MLFAPSLLGQSQTPVFTVDANLQTIAVQVTDRHGNDVSGLTASDFSLLEDGRPQKIAFFEAAAQPISLAILLDVGRSMDFEHKLDRALDLLAPLVRGNLPDDEIFFMPFTSFVPEYRLTGRLSAMRIMIFCTTSFGYSME